MAKVKFVYVVMCLSVTIPCACDIIWIHYNSSVFILHSAKILDDKTSTCCISTYIDHVNSYVNSYNRTIQVWLHNYE